MSASCEIRFFDARLLLPVQLLRPVSPRLATLAAMDVESPSRKGSQTLAIVMTWCVTLPNPRPRLSPRHSVYRALALMGADLSRLTVSARLEDSSSECCHPPCGTRCVWSVSAQPRVASRGRVVACARSYADPVPLRAPPCLSQWIRHGKHQVRCLYPSSASRILDFSSRPGS
jgi:hypothetical protein